MTYNYDKLVATATRLINQFGRNVTKRTTTTTGDAWNPTKTDVDTTIKAVASSFKENEIDGTLIQSNDRLFLTYSDVTTDDKIVDGGDILSVVNVKTINPGETILIYKVQARK